jgi:hypothetical protein
MLSHEFDSGGVGAVTGSDGLLWACQVFASLR